MIDVVRFYYESKLLLGLERIWPTRINRHRAIRKEVLIKLSKLNAEYRSMCDNFRHNIVADFDESTKNSKVIERICCGGTKSQNLSSETKQPLSTDSKWSTGETARLINGLCRNNVSDSNSRSELTCAWDDISAFVKTKTPVE